SSCSGPANRPPLRTRAGVFAAAVKKPPAALGFCMRSGLLLATMLASSSLAAETPRTSDQLLAQGWEIAGYASGYDNRTSLILFRHPGVNALVQCGVLYDVNAFRAQSSIATSCGSAWGQARGSSTDCAAKRHLRRARHRERRRRQLLLPEGMA